MRAKSKTGKTSAKRKLPETGAECQERLSAKYAEPGMFHREMLFLSRDSFQELQAELWELSKALLDARRRGAWYRNTSQCFQYGVEHLDMGDLARGGLFAPPGAIP